MNTIFQNILVFTALAIAIWFLIKKYFFKKSKTKKPFGEHDCDNCQ